MLDLEPATPERRFHGLGRVAPQIGRQVSSPAQDLPPASKPARGDGGRLHPRLI
jgi:hypothetical protein